MRTVFCDNISDICFFSIDEMLQNGFGEQLSFMNKGLQ